MKAIPGQLSDQFRLRISLRTRLALWVVVIFTVIQFTFCLLILLYQRAAVTTWFDDRLDRVTNRVIQEISPLAPGFEPEALASIAQLHRGTAMLGGFVIAVYHHDGSLIAASETPFRTEAGEDVRLALAKGHAVFGDHRLQQAAADDLQLRSLAKSFRGVDGEFYGLLTMKSDTSLTQMLDLVNNIIIISIPLGILAIAIGAWFIAGIAVAPLQRLESFARRLSPASIDQQVSMEQAYEEIAGLARELDQARERIEMGFRVQERFISNVSHELKTPIAVLLTEAQTLDQQKLDDPSRRFVQSVQDELRRLGRLIDSFLLLTRVREGRSATTIQRPVIINDLIMDAVEHCAAMARHYGVRLMPTLLANEDQLDLAVAGDADLLRTMLDNLIRNAIRFSPEGELIDIRVSPQDDEVVICVRDRGAGIPESVIETIFDRFTQASQEERRGRGHGLGLEIAQGIAELHGGHITVRNCEDRGCEFAVHLPCRLPQSTATMDS